MSVLIREDLNKTKVAVPISVNCAFPVEVAALARTYRGVKIGEFIDLHPYATVQRQAVREAKVWLGHMVRQGLTLLGNETDIRLWGPYRPKSHLYRYAPGHDEAATSFMEDEDPFPDGMAKMLLTGHFLNSKQHTVEHA